jgi:Protein of unknown function (DUF4446)
MTEMERLFADLGPALLGLLMVAFAALLLLHLRLQARVNRMLLQYQRLLRGGAGGNLEELLDRQLEMAEGTLARVADLEGQHGELRDAMRRTIQRVGLVRFNPFEDTGGNQSFALALLDANGDGVIVSSLHSRTGTRVYAKAVASGRSEAALSDEESRAVSEALGGAGSRAPGAA